MKWLQPHLRRRILPEQIPIEVPDVHVAPDLGALFAILGLGTIQDLFSRGQGAPELTAAESTRTLLVISARSI